MQAKTLKPHQLDAIAKLDNGKILCGDVGTGKTLTALGYYVAKESGQDIYVITTAKKRDSLDWEAEAAAMGIGTHEGVSLFGQLHVDSWNNLHKYTEVRNAFFIFDEQRLVGSGAWVRAFYKIAKDNRWILLSATPGDVWLDYIPTFVANGYYKNATAFKREHVVYTYYSKFPKVDRYLGVNKLVRYRNALLVEMPYMRHTTRVIQDVEVEYDKDLFEQVVTKRWHVYEKRPLRDVAELFSVMRKVVNTDASRISEVRRLMKKHPKLIVFYNFDYELEALRTLQPSSTKKRSQSTTQDGRRDFGPESIAPSPEPESVVWKKTKTGLRYISSAGIETKSDDSKKRDPTAGAVESTSTEEGESWQTTPLTNLFVGSDQDSKLTSETLSETRSNKRSSEQTSNPTQEKRSRLGNSFQIAEWNGHKHEPIPKTDSWVYLVQYRAGAEGWNCVETDAMCFYSLTYAYRDFYQAQGRIDRLDTPFTTLFYYVLISHNSLDAAIRKSLRSKKNFNESSFTLNKTS